MNNKLAVAIDAENWDNEETQLIVLSQLMKERKLTLVLGAGISTPFGLPNWSQLLTNLIPKGKSPDLTGLSAPLIASKIKVSYYDNDDASFAKAVKESIYKNFELSPLKLSNIPLLSAISASIMNLAKQGTAHVINFNFDNLLEIYLKYHGFSVDAYDQADSWASGNQVSIYHLHGYLPYDSSNNSPNIVFDQTSFTEVVSSQWNKKITQITGSHFPVFIGISGTDTHLHDLLRKIKADHPSRKTYNLPYNGIRFCRENDNVADILQTQMGIYSIKVKDYDDIPKILMKACQLAATGKLTFTD